MFKKFLMLSLLTLSLFIIPNVSHAYLSDSELGMNGGNFAYFDSSITTTAGLKCGDDWHSITDTYGKVSSNKDESYKSIVYSYEEALSKYGTILSVKSSKLPFFSMYKIISPNGMSLQFLVDHISYSNTKEKIVAIYYGPYTKNIDEIALEHSKY